MPRNFRSDWVFVDPSHSFISDFISLLGVLMLADLDLTKHLGRLRATEELTELCQIDKGDYVLDVGCGVGVTPCYLAEKHGCRAVGIDNYNQMIERANERAKRRGLGDRVKFKVADVQDLPFENDLFDVVIGCF